MAVADVTVFPVAIVMGGGWWLAGGGRLLVASRETRGGIRTIKNTPAHNRGILKNGTELPAALSE